MLDREDMACRSMPGTRPTREPPIYRGGSRHWRIGEDKKTARCCRTVCSNSVTDKLAGPKEVQQFAFALASVVDRDEINGRDSGGDAYTRIRRRDLENSRAGAWNCISVYDEGETHWAIKRGTQHRVRVDNCPLIVMDRLVPLGPVALRPRLSVGLPKNPA